jgi:hypothetical protein
VNGAGEPGETLGLAVRQRGHGPAKGVLVVGPPCPDVERLEADQRFDDRRVKPDVGAQSQVAGQVGQVDLGAVGDQDQRCDVAVQQAGGGPDQGQDAYSK